jgi:hypothetical protein
MILVTISGKSFFQQNFNLKITRIQRGLDLGCCWMLFFFVKKGLLARCYVLCSFLLFFFFFETKDLYSFFVLLSLQPQVALSGLKYVHVGMYDKDQNEMIFFYFQL